MPTCSNCKSTNVKQKEDKTRIIGYAAHVPMYAKKWVCRDCGHEWE